MPLRNRVTPFGEIVALSGRGLIMGNRGVLHNDHRQIVRQWQVKRWIACRLAFRGRRRAVMRPHSYTELFFLDEATAFAAGHRPCAECRHEDYRRFRALWVSCHGGSGRADEIDGRLHAERVLDRNTKRTYRATPSRLPDGAYVVLENCPWVVRGDRLFQWSDSAYAGWRPKLNVAEVDVLTPRSTVAVMESGYVPGFHPSVETAKRLP